jgi:hypothetical protein
MRAFLSLEASSLGRRGFPVEIAWIFEDGAADSFLIRPAADWSEWNPAAEAVHGISRNRLASDGVAAATVATCVLEALGGHEVFAGTPSCGGKWLSLLLRSAGLPPRAVHLRDIEVGLEELAGALLAPFLPSSEIHRATRKILADAEARFADRKPVHHALADARLQHERWLAVSELAHALTRGR